RPAPPGSSQCAVRREAGIHLSELRSAGRRILTPGSDTRTIGEISLDVQTSGPLQKVDPMSDQRIEPPRGITRRDLKRVTTASIVGNTIEFYDFSVYGTLTALVFGELFFPSFG